MVINGASGARGVNGTKARGGTIPPDMARKIWAGLSPKARKTLTHPEALRNILADSAADKPRKSERLTIRLYEEDKERIAAAAAAAGVSMANYVTMLVYFATQDK